jgi:hypothetical protein
MLEAHVLPMPGDILYSMTVTSYGSLSLLCSTRRDLCIHDGNFMQRVQLDVICHR